MLIVTLRDQQDKGVRGMLLWVSCLGKFVLKNKNIYNGREILRMKIDGNGDE